MGALQSISICLLIGFSSMVCAANTISVDRNRIDYGKSTTVNITGTQLGNRNLVLSPNIPSVDFSKYFLEPVTHIEKLNNFIIVADEQTLYVVHIVDGAANILSRQDIPFPIKSIVSNGKLAFILGKNNQVNVYQINHEKLAFRKKLTYKANIDHIFATPSRLYIANKKHDLDIFKIDYKKKKLFEQAAKYSLLRYSNINNIYVKGRYVYLATNSGLEIINVHSLKSVEHFYTFKSSGPITDVNTDEKFIYIAEEGVGLTQLEIKKKSVIWRNSLNRIGKIHKILSNGKQIFVDSNHSGLSLIDFPDNAQAQIRSRYYSAKPFKHCFLNKDHIITVKGNTVEWVNIKKRSLPSNINSQANYGGSRKVYIKDNLAYVADWFSGLHIYDISAEHQPKLISSYPTKGSPKGVVVHDHYAFVADDDHGLLVLDVQNSKSPKYVKYLDTPGLAYTVVLKPPFLYLADHHAGIHIIDIKKPQEPWIVGSFDTPGKAWSLAIKGHTAWVADDTTGVLVLDVSNPHQIKQLANYRTGSAAEDIVIKDDIAYVSFFDDGLHLLDIKNIKQPKMLNKIKTHGNARGVVLGKHKAYVSDWHAGVHVIDVRSPKLAKSLGYYDTPGSVWGLGVKQNTIVAMDWWGGISVLEEKKNKLVWVGGYHGRGEALDVKIKNGFAYVAHSGGGIQVFDVRTALNPIWITGAEIEGEAKSLFIEGDRAYVTNGENLIQSFDISNPFKLKKLANIHLTTSAEQIVTRKNIAFIRNKGKGWSIVDLNDLNKVRSIQNFDSHINSLLLQKDTLYVIDDKRIRSFDVSQPKRAAIKTVWSIGDIASADIHDNILVAGIKNRGIAVYQLEQFESKKLSYVATRSNISTIKLVKNSQVVAGTDDGEIMELAFSPTKPLHLRSINPSLSPFNSFDIYKDTVYLTTPQNSITSLQLLPKLDITVKEKVLKATFPADMPMGSYQFIFFDPFTGERETLTKPIQVGLGKGKNNFTLKDLEKAMKKLKLLQ